jgi:cob(I)alamin adenosyltransferase
MTDNQMSEKKPKGLIHVYTGNGKGKTTAAFGIALRAAGQGLHVLIIQFMKAQSSGEVKALNATDLPITIKQFGRRVFFHSRTCEPIDIHRAKKGLECFQSALTEGKYDLIVLDEINMAIAFELLSVQEVIEVIQTRPPSLHLVMTGRKAPDEIINMADLVTEMKEIKHPYSQGINAEKGLEY